MSPDAIDRVVRRHASTLGLPCGYSAHSMRATFITTALDNGAKLEDEQKGAGHRAPTEPYPMSDAAFHYPPELFALLVDAIPVLCRSKRDVVLMFRGAGVPASMVADIGDQLMRDRNSINNYEISRTVLTRTNEGGDPPLAARRELLWRVTEFEDFSRC